MLAVIVAAVNVPIQPVLWYNIEDQLANVEPVGRADLIRLLIYHNLDPVINFTEYEIWTNSQAFNTIKFTDPVTKGEIAAILVKYLGLELDAIDYPINAPYDPSIKTKYEAAGYKNGTFDTTRIWGYLEELKKAGISITDLDKNVKRVELIKYLVDAFVIKHPEYKYLKDKINKLKTLYSRSLTTSAEDAAYIYVFENYFLVEDKNNKGKAIPLLADKELYKSADFFGRTYEDYVARDEAFALFARIALADVKKAEDLGLLVPVREFQNVVNYKAKYDGQLVFCDLKLPKDVVVEVKAYTADDLLKMWEEKHKNIENFETMKEEFEKKLAELKSFTLVKTESGKVYILLNESIFSYDFKNDPKPAFVAEGNEFAEHYLALPDESRSEEITKRVVADVVNRVKDDYTVYSDKLDKDIDISKIPEFTMKIYTVNGDVIENKVNKVYPKELVRFTYVEEIKMVTKVAMDKATFVGAKSVFYPVAARILYSQEPMTLGKLREFVGTFGEQLMSPDVKIVEVINMLKGFLEVFDEAGVPEDAVFAAKAEFTNNPEVPVPVISIENAEIS